MQWAASTDNVDPSTSIEYEIRVNGTIIDVVPGITEYVAYTETEGRNEVTVVASTVTATPRRRATCS